LDCDDADPTLPAAADCDRVLTADDCDDNDDALGDNNDFLINSMNFQADLNALFMHQC
jgi:hypothetical protein